MQVFVTPPTRKTDALYGIEFDEYLDGVVDVRVAGVARRNTFTIAGFIKLCSDRVVCRQAMGRQRRH